MKTKLPKTRVCKKCGKRKRITEFPYSYKAKGYRRHECASCMHKRESDWHKKVTDPNYIPPGPETERTCVVCGKTRPIDEFAKVYSKKSRGKIYHQHTCVYCAKKIHASRMRKARKENPEKYKEHQRKHRKLHLERVRRQRRESGKRLKDAAYAAYGGYKCVCCGETEESMLTIDHIHETGAKHRKELGHRRGTMTVRGAGGQSIYYWLKKHNYPSGFQVLCYNCNISKHRNKGVCAHKLHMK